MHHRATEAKDSSSASVASKSNSARRSSTIHADGSNCEVFIERVDGDTDSAGYYYDHKDDDDANVDDDNVNDGDESTRKPKKILRRRKKRRGGGRGLGLRFGMDGGTREERRIRPVNSRINDRKKSHTKRWLVTDGIFFFVLVTVFAVIVFALAFGTIMLCQWLATALAWVYRSGTSKSFYSLTAYATLRRDAGGRILYPGLDWDLYEAIHKGRSKSAAGDIPSTNKSNQGNNLRQRITNYETNVHNNASSPESSSYKYYKYYGRHIMENGCLLTVVLMDPRVPILEKGHKLWFALESVAAFSSYACVLIQTAQCEVQEQMKEEGHIHYSDISAVQEEVFRRIYNHSLPLFRRMMELGHVRVSYLDHTKYKLKSCNNFYNPSSALMNINYWQDGEFLPGVDSDTVLIIQDDAVLCHALTPTILSSFKKYAFVGAVWRKSPGPLNPTPPEGMCIGMPIRWKTWTFPSRRRQQYKDSITADVNMHNNGHGTNNNSTVVDDIIVIDNDDDDDVPKSLNSEFPTICNGNDGVAPLGNGGLSLRSRKWMVKAIKTCPHVRWSGLDPDLLKSGNNNNDNIGKRPLLCKVFDDVNEDFYFGTILRGMRNAPLPHAYDASLFTMEMMWPEQSLNLYGGLDGDGGYESQRDAMFRSWGGKNAPSNSYVDTKDCGDLCNDDVDKLVQMDTSIFFQSVQYEEKTYTTPIGMHKPWWYQPNKLLLDGKVSEMCPFLKYIFEPEDSKWREDHDGDAANYGLWSGLDAVIPD